MLSYWILLYLIFGGCLCNHSCGGNNSCTCSRPEKKPDYNLIQPRPFNGFTVQNTCGCENTNE